MKIFEGILNFDWDKGNQGKNFKLHGVTDQECEEIFFDSQKQIYPLRSLAPGTSLAGSKPRGLPRNFGFRACPGVHTIDKDVLHSGEEERVLLIGKTKKGRLLFLVFTWRGNKVRVISARDLNRREKHFYEK